MAKDIPDFFSDKLFEIEHAIDIFAYSYVQIPAHEMYSKDKLEQFRDLINRCHIYMIGFFPTIEFIGADERDGSLFTSFVVNEETFVQEWPLPLGAKLETEDGAYYIACTDGTRRFPSMERMVLRLHHKKPLLFDILYIGQAYGQDGSRNALERLTKHETLQKISLREKRENARLNLLLIEIQPVNRMITLINPHAEDRSDSDTRIAKSLHSLFDTTESQQVSLYEAAMIRFFKPKYNIKFKDSFPSTNHKILRECYEKDMAAVVAEFCVDNALFYLTSSERKPQPYHIVSYNIHGQADRDVFFGIREGELDPLPT